MNKEEDNFNHKDNSFYKAVGITRQDAERISKHWRNVLDFISENKNQGFPRSKLVQIVEKEINHLTTHETAILFDLVFDYFDWTMEKLLKAKMINPYKPKDDSPRPEVA